MPFADPAEPDVSIGLAAVGALDRRNRLTSGEDPQIVLGPLTRPNLGEKLVDIRLGEIADDEIEVMTAPAGEAPTVLPVLALDLHNRQARSADMDGAHDRLIFVGGV